MEPEQWAGGPIPAEAAYRVIEECVDVLSSLEFYRGAQALEDWQDTVIENLCGAGFIAKPPTLSEGRGPT